MLIPRDIDIININKNRSYFDMIQTEMSSFCQQHMK